MATREDSSPPPRTPFDAQPWSDDFNYPPGGLNLIGGWITSPTYGTPLTIVGSGSVRNTNAGGGASTGSNNANAVYALQGTAAFTLSITFTRDTNVATFGTVGAFLYVGATLKIFASVEVHDGVIAFADIQDNNGNDVTALNIPYADGSPCRVDFVLDGSNATIYVDGVIQAGPLPLSPTPGVLTVLEQYMTTDGVGFDTLRLNRSAITPT